MEALLVSVIILLYLSPFNRTATGKSPSSGKACTFGFLSSVPPLVILRERERENKKIMDISLCPFQSNIGKRKRERSTTHRNRFCFVTGDYNIYLFIQQVFVECLPCARLYSRLGGEE